MQMEIADGKIMNLQTLSQHLKFRRTACQLPVANWYLKKVEDIGVEPMTLCVQGRCSSQLS